VDVREEGRGGVGEAINNQKKRKMANEKQTNKRTQKLCQTNTKK